jgi:beta-mannosidase
MSLNGTWKLHGSDGQRGRLEQAMREPIDEAYFIDAQVPGEVHLDLMRAGRIADVYAGTGALSARWVEESVWTYRRTFELDEVPDGRAWLVFDGLDLSAVIWLNGEEIGRHANAFYPCRIEVTHKLKRGSNALAVQIESGLWSAAEKPSVGYQHWPDQVINKRHWLRKPQFQFGWDWSPRLINVGIFKDVRLEWTDEPARIERVVPLVEMSQDLSRASVRVRVLIEGLMAQSFRGILNVELVEAEAKAQAAVEIHPGVHACEVRIEIERPALWWPVGMGEPARYTLRAHLEMQGAHQGHKIETPEVKIGFRRVRIDQSVHPRGGRYFIIEINNRRIFARGANLVPADLILARIDQSRYQKLIELALEQNLNFLRVWGGGVYESDDFYELCDERGIMVWQEFIFACSRYPTTDQAFFEDVRREATYNIRRLASHPSLIAWCGNNEIEWGDWDWDYGRSGVIMPDHAFFHITLPRLLQEEDPSRYYQPSSPWSPDGLHPNSDDAGDQHPWSVGFFQNDFRAYRRMTCRFPDEGGILGPTALPTMRMCVGEDAKVMSFAWQVHDNSVTTWTQPSAPDEMIRQWLGKEPREMSIEEFTYWAGLIQGEGLREYCENFRRRMFDSAAAVYWMLNDCWPATRSWTTVDYFHRRTPAFHAVRRAMSPVHVVLAVEDEQVVVFGINDTPEPVLARLRYGVFEFSGERAGEAHQAEVVLPAGQSVRLRSFPRQEWAREEASAPYAMLERDGRLISRNRLIGPMFSQLQWSPAQIQMTMRTGEVELTSATFAWGVCLDLDGERPLADNFFDLYPGIPYSMKWSDSRPPVIRFVGNQA